MIKPTYLWALCKTCEDSKWIGDICRFLGGQDVTLDFGQKQVAEMVKMDSEWMDERINWNREAARMRQARARERRAAERDTAANASREVTRDKRDEADVTQSHAAVTPSIRPSVRPSVYNQERERERENALALKTGSSNVSPEPPTFDMVMAVASDGTRRINGETIPESFVREWYSLMQTSGWRDTQGRMLLPHGWQGKLAFAWRDERRRLNGDAPKIKVKGGRNELYHEENLAQSAGI